MDNLSLKEERQILNAARLAGKDAPERLDTDRARAFVHSTMTKRQRRNIFRSPVPYIAFAVAAFIIVFLLVFKPDTGSGTLEVLQQEQSYAAADSLDNTTDSLVVSGIIELKSNDE